MDTNLSFEKFSAQAFEYVNKLAGDLEHPEERERVLNIWRAVLHTVRDRIHIGEAIQLMQPLPTIFRGIYAEGWKYREEPLYKYETLEEMKNQVKNLQQQYGEEEFPWKKSTEEIIAITVYSLSEYLPEEQLTHIIEQLPQKIQDYFK